MSLQHFGRGALRVAKNYTKGYSDVQAKVRDATSNDPWGPSGTQMNELAQLTYNQQDFVEIMEMLDKRLNDKGKNWMHVFKSLTVLDYLLHAGSENVVLYFKDNIYVIKTLKEFQYIDEDAKDQGANVRQKAKDITTLLMDEGRLREQRRSRAHMRDRMLGEGPVGTGDDFENENVRRKNENTQARTQKRKNKEQDDLEKALALSRQSLADETQRAGELTAEERDLQEALRQSKEEEERRLKALEDSNSRALFDDGTQLAGPSAHNNNPFPLIDTSLQNSQQTGLQPQYTAFANNPSYQEQWAAQQAYIAQQEETARLQAAWEQLQQQQALAQQQVLYEQQQQQALFQQQQQQQQQQALLQQQQQQQQQAQWAAYQQQQQASLFAQPTIQAQPTGYGSNNPFALAAGTASPQPPMPNFGAQSPSPAFGGQSSSSAFGGQSTSSAFGGQSTSAWGAQSTSPAFGAASQQPQQAPSPQPTPSPTSANTLANARRPNAISGDAHSRLDNLFANRDDGQDTFGNIGNLRYGQAAGKTLANQPTGSHNPFARQAGPSEQPFFSI